MKHRFLCGVRGLVVTGLILGGVTISSSVAGVTNASLHPRQFLVFDATLYRNKPSFAVYPIHPITIVYEARLFNRNQPAHALPDETTVRAMAKELGGLPESVILDIERWPLKGDVQRVKDSVSKFAAIFAWLKAEAPNLRLGAYGTVPLPDYWRAIRAQTSKDHQAWQQDNDRLGEITAQVDALFPSIYTFYPDRQGWATYAVAQLTEAKRIARGKPIYAFLWPQYHESNALLRLQPIEPDYWELQLNTVYQHADGLVIWGGWGEHGPEPWDEAAPWWQVTKRFLQQISSPPAPTGLTVR